MGRAMAYASTGLATNIALNGLFIGAFGWGVTGAAWATNAGMGVYVLCNLIYFASGGPSFEARLLSLKSDRTLRRRVLALGLPSLVLQLMTAVQQFVVYRLLSRYGGAEDIAFFGALLRIIFLAALPAVGMMRALQPVVGINFGAGRIDRVRRALWVTGAGMGAILTVISLPIVLAPGGIIGLILPGQVFSISALWNARVYLSVLPIVAVAYVALTYFPAVGQPKPATFIALARQLALFVPVALLFAAVWGVRGVYLALFWTDVVVVLAAAVLLARSVARLQPPDAKPTGAITDGTSVGKGQR